MIAGSDLTPGSAQAQGARLSKTSTLLWVTSTTEPWLEAAGAADANAANATAAMEKILVKEGIVGK